jgi:mannose-1-phosphate guanylyltransferase
MVLYGVIMAGGFGTRFWPYSRSNKPKQLLNIFSDKSMMNETVDRLKPLIPSENIYVATNDHLANLMKSNIQGVNYVIEPIPKNTAACIGLSAISILEKDPEAVMFIETSDHVYKDEEAYIDTIRKAVIAAIKNKIVLIGITPTFPHTGLGYIQKGDIFNDDIPDTFIIEGFKEKPDLKTAKNFLEEGNFLWNSGMFIAKCSIMLEEMRKYMPDLYQGLMKIKHSKFDKKIINEVFENLENISIDYGIMEKSNNTVVVKTNMPWDDIGDFIALERWFPKDDNKNTVLCNFQGNAVNCIVMSQTRKVIANNVSGIIVVDTPDATLIMQKEDMQNIKKLYSKIKEADLEQYLKDYVVKYSKNIISHESDECEVDTDGLLALSGVSNLEIKRDNNTLTIEGVEDDVGNI